MGYETNSHVGTTNPECNRVLHNTFDDMKRYLAFYGDCYYASGGIADFVGDFDSEEEAISAIMSTHKEDKPTDNDWDLAWCHVWDSKLKVITFTR